jgi:hypothetical protein
MTNRRRFIVLLSVTLVGACTAQRTPEVGPPAGQTRADLLTAEQLRDFADAGTAVRTLRSPWLRRRSGSLQGGGSQIWVYRDGIRLGGPEELARMEVTSIESIQYYDGTAAAQRWGLGHENGAIIVTSRTR